MVMETPQWLAEHGGTIRSSADGRRLLVYFSEKPQYQVNVIPAMGQFSCRVIQSNSGKPIPTSQLKATPEEAARQGMEDLRVVLGW